MLCLSVIMLGYVFNCHLADVFKYAAGSCCMNVEEVFAELALNVGWTDVFKQ